jgi:hypothetical protein
VGYKNMNKQSLNAAGISELTAHLDTESVNLVTPVPVLNNSGCKKDFSPSVYETAFFFVPVHNIRETEWNLSCDRSVTQKRGEKTSIFKIKFFSGRTVAA